MPLNYIENGLVNIKKIAWLVPTLLTIVEQWEAFAQTRNDFEKEDLFPLYREIVNCTNLAMDEKETPEHFKRDYRKILYKYESKIDSITDPGIQISPNYYNPWYRCTLALQNTKRMNISGSVVLAESEMRFIRYES